MRHATGLPYHPIRQTMYTPDELLDGLQPADRQSYIATPDFQIYVHYVRNGRHVAPAVEGLMRALHDQSITQALAAELERHPRVVAIMGGHKLERGSPVYRDIAELARGLTLDGMTILSGGGPGAMEAAHLGAMLATGDQQVFDEAIDELRKKAPILPRSETIVRKDGSVDDDVVAAVFDWYMPAFQISRTVQHRSMSIAIPTWHYGNEPFTPFATNVAKYFQNSIREDGLLAVAANGVVFAPGKAGTIQEIFQDAAQNYYKSFFDRFSPMVLLGRSYWSEQYPVWTVLERLFAEGEKADEFRKRVLLTDSVDEARSFLGRFEAAETELVRQWHGSNVRD